MPARKVGLPNDVPDALARGLADLRAKLDIPADFPPEVVAAAERAAAAPRLPELDRTDLELVTIDPPGSRDLDQALHIARRPGGGYVVSYAIADVAAFVTAGDPVDLEAHRRGTTLYAPDRRTPLHPPVLSEGAASLLPDQVRPALLWTVSLDAKGRTTDAVVTRALVRSREQLDYDQAQAEIDGGSPRESLALLKEVGQWREQRERERGGVSLQIPEQEIQPDGDRWHLVFRAPLPVEGWNAQISLAHRHGGSPHHALRAGRHPADHAAGRPRLGAPAAPDRQGAAHQLAGRARLSRVRPQPGPDPGRPCRDAQRLHRVVPRRGLPGVQWRRSRGSGARGPGQRLRARDRAAAPAGRPLRRRVLRRAVR